MNSNVICTRTSFTPLALINAFGAYKLLFVLSLNYVCLSFTGQSMEETLYYLGGGTPISQMLVLRQILTRSQDGGKLEH